MADDLPDPIKYGLRAWAKGDLDALATVLDPAVTLRAATPGPWDCTDRDDVMRLLREREATRDRARARSFQVSQVDEQTFIVSGEADTATRVTVAGGKVIAMQQFTTEPRK